MDESQTTFTEECIEQWLVAKISSLSSIKPEHIDTKEEFASFGLDSVSSLGLSGELEEWLGEKLSPTLVYDHPVIADCVQAIARLKSARQKKPKTFPHSINIAASFTAEPIEEFIAVWLKQLGIQSRIEFSPYNQTLQELLNPAGELYRDPKASVVLLVRLEDFFRFHAGKISGDVAQLVAHEFVDAVRAFAQVVPNQIYFGLCAHTPKWVRRLELTKSIEALDQEIIASLSRLRNIQLLDLRFLEDNFILRQKHDNVRIEHGHIPFTQEYFAAMGMTVARRIFGQVRNPYKAVLVDCDDTLWKGVVGEVSELSQLEVKGAHRGLQEFLKTKLTEGLILCLVSKNNPDDAWKVFDKHPGMVLRRDDIAAWRINWERKSKNILDLAGELQLDPGSFIFIDDSPVECLEVKEALPEVFTHQFRAEQKNLQEVLKHHWIFDMPAATDEGRQRTRMYQQEQQRRELKRNLPDLEDFIASLKLEVSISPAREEDYERIAQLTQRTNQFNSTTIRQNTSEITTLAESADSFVDAVRVKDKFGDYGLVGVMIYGASEGALRVSHFIVSCRVLGRRVEKQMIKHLTQQSHAFGLQQIALHYRKTDKNKPLTDFFSSFGKPLVSLDDGAREAYVLRLEDVDQALAQARLEHTLEVRRIDLSKRSSYHASLPAIEAHLELIAGLTGDTARILGFARSKQRLRRPALCPEYLAPKTPWQLKIAQIWEEVLNISPIGIRDNFFELGGDSLQTAEVMAGMAALGIPAEISLQNAPEPTISSLEQMIRQHDADERVDLFTDVLSLRDEVVKSTAEVAADQRQRLPAPTIHQTLANGGRCETIFITGATGYIAGHLLAEFLKNPGIKLIIALVRASSTKEGLQRITANLMRYGLWQDSFLPRISVVLGDLTEEGLGLTPEDRRRVIESSDLIAHSACWVNFVFPYNLLRQTNVAATIGIMKLAQEKRAGTIPVHFISTFGVVMSPDHGRDAVIFENTELSHGEGLLNGYEQTKYVSDQILWHAMANHGFPACIYRPALVTGSSTGKYLKFDEFFASAIKGVIQLGSVPDIESPMEIMPIDFFAKAVAHIVNQPEFLGVSVFSLYPKALSFHEFYEVLNDYGYSVRLVPWDTWKKDLLYQPLAKLKTNALFPFVDFIRNMNEDQVYFRRTDRSLFNNAIRDMDYPLLEPKELIKRYLDYFVEIGFLFPPCAVGQK